MLYPKDPKVRVERHEKTLKIEWNWGGPYGYTFVVIGMALNILFAYTTTLPGQNDEARDLSNIVALVVSGSIVIILAACYGLTIAHNKTIMHADHDRFVVRVSPFPWYKTKLVAAKGIQQFFVGLPTSPQTSGHKALYLLEEESHYVLISSVFPSSFAAHQICHELQDWYGLEDLPVFGQNTLPHQPGPRGQRNL